MNNLALPNRKMGGRVAPNFLESANAALLDGRYEDAIRDYFTHFRDAPEAVESIGFNFILARRRFRLQRNRESTETLIVNCGADSSGAALRMANLFQGRLLMLGPEAAHEDLLRIEAEGGADLPAQVLNFVLKNPTDLVRLPVPCAAGALVGLVYHLVWGADVVHDLPPDIELPTVAVSDGFAGLPQDWESLCRRDPTFLRLFSTEEGGVATSKPITATGAPTLGAWLIGAASEAFEAFGGFSAILGSTTVGHKVPFSEPESEAPFLVDVVIAIYNALDDVKACVASLKRAHTTCRFRVILVNDGSEQDTTDWLRQVVREPFPPHMDLVLLEHPKNRGYTQAVNTGLRYTDAAYVVTLNSDTIVTDGWLEGQIRCIESAPEIGICGPMSNAASWQNVPELYGPDKAFAINALPEGITADDMAAIVARASVRSYPRTTFVNGFCFMLTRAVIEAVGYMDEEAFPVGYGEENDFCIRAQDAGFALAYADDTYVFHAKSKSFGSARRKELAKAGSDAIKRKHSPEKFAALVDRVKVTSDMDAVRDRIQAEMANGMDDAEPTQWEALMNQSILFVLPVKGGSGGAHSVVQEAVAMRRMGVNARVAVEHKNLSSFRRQYHDVPEAKDVLVGFSPRDLPHMAAEFDVVVATIFNSVGLINRVVQACPWVVPAYYIQDYEPLFFQADDPNWRTACDSYAAVPGMVNFAKTDWIRREVERFHGVRVDKVRPSIDHDVYTLRAVGSMSNDSRLHLTAMIRPNTPRRGAGRTMALLARLSRKHGDALRITLFGCNPDDSNFLALERNFPHENIGVLTRPQVAALLQSSDLFLDMSDYQAFGRTGLEAMACGSLALVPAIGGADEYAVHSENAIVVDTFNSEACFSAVDAVVADRARFSAMRIAALVTANRYSTRRAALSLLEVLGRAVALRRRAQPAPRRLKTVLLPALGPDAKPTRAGQSRVVAPFVQDYFLKDLRVHVITTPTLPPAGEIDLVVMQPANAVCDNAQLNDWLSDVKAAGGHVVLDLGVEDVTQGDLSALLTIADAVTVADAKVPGQLGLDLPQALVICDRLCANTWERALNRMTQPTMGDGTVIRIGYFGPENEAAALAPLTATMRALSDELGEQIHIEVIGAFQKGPPLFGRRIGLPRRRDYEGFGDWLPQVANWDIVLLPFNDPADPRNRLHFLEAASLGGAILCSCADELTDLARDHETCLRVDRDGSWDHSLRQLIKDASLRKALAKRVREELQEKHLTASSEAEYRALLETLR